MKKGILIGILSTVGVAVVTTGIVLGVTLSKKNTGDKPTPTTTTTVVTTTVPTTTTETPITTTTSANNPTESTGLISDEGYRYICIDSMKGLNATVTFEGETTEAFEGFNLYDGYIVDVSSDTSMTIQLDEDKYVYLYPNTQIHITSQGSGKKYRTNIYVDHGKVLAEIESKLSEEEEFYLSATNSVMAVRGTTFGLEVNPGDIETVVTYAVYKGVTELYVFDNSSGEMVSGKLTDLTNDKLEIVIPKTEIIDFEEMKEITEKWLEDIEAKYEDVEDANNKMNEVEITITKPTVEDYSDVTDKIDSEVSYSLLEYEAEGYIGAYDGLEHKISVTTNNENAIISYSLTEDGEYTKENTFAFKTPGEYRVYYHIECEGYAAKNDYEVIKISKADLDVLEIEEIAFKNQIAGTNVVDALATLDLDDYYTITGSEADNDAIAKLTLNSLEAFGKGTNEYEVSIVLPDTIKDCYNEASITISAEAYGLILLSTSSYYTNTSSGMVVAQNIAGEYDYFGRVDMDGFEDPVIGFDNEEKTILSDATVSWIVDGEKVVHYEIKNGDDDPLSKNYISLKDAVDNRIGIPASVTYNGLTIATEVDFMYFERREQPILSVSKELVSSDGSFEPLSGSLYFLNYETAGIALTDGKVNVSRAYISDYFKVSYVDYIEGAGDIYLDFIEGDSPDYPEIYQSNNTDATLSLSAGIINKLVYKSYDTSSYFGAELTLYLYVGKDSAEAVPQWETSDTLVKYDGENHSLIINSSNSTVTYKQADGTYSDTARSYKELGTYDVEFKLSNDFMTVELTEAFTIGQVPMENDNSYTIDIRTGNNTPVKYLYSDIIDRIKNGIVLIDSSSGEEVTDFTVEIQGASHELTSDDNIAQIDYKITSNDPGLEPYYGSIGISYDYDGTLVGGTNYYVPSEATITDTEVSLEAFTSDGIQVKVPTNDDAVIYYSTDYTSWTSKVPHYDEEGTYIVYAKVVVEDGTRDGMPTLIAYFYRVELTVIAEDTREEGVGGFETTLSLMSGSEDVYQLKLTSEDATLQNGEVLVAPSYFDSNKIFNVTGNPEDNQYTINGYSYSNSSSVLALKENEINTIVLEIAGNDAMKPVVATFKCYVTVSNSFNVGSMGTQNVEPGTDVGSYEAYKTISVRDKDGNLLTLDKDYKITNVYTTNTQSGAEDSTTVYKSQYVTFHFTIVGLNDYADYADAQGLVTYVGVDA